MTSSPTRRFSIVIATLVALLLVAVATLTGGSTPGPGPLVLPSSTGAYPTGASTLGPALFAATAAAQNYSEDGWAPVLAMGYDAPNSFVFPGPVWGYSAQSPSTNCGWRAIGGASLNATVFPATNPSLGVGVADAWLVVFTTLAGGVLLVTVLNGSAAPLGVMPPGPCVYDFGHLEPIASGIMDSSQAVQSANAAGGSAFLATYPQPYAVFSVTGAEHPGSIHMCPEGGCPPGTGMSTWTVSYSTCGPFVQDNTTVCRGFGVTVDPTDGAVLASSEYATGVPGLRVAVW